MLLLKNKEGLNMGYDMNMLKMKRGRLEELKKAMPNITLSDMWSYDWINYNSISSIDEDIWSNDDIFIEFFEEYNIKCDNNECIELSKKNLEYLVNWLDIKFREKLKQMEETYEYLEVEGILNALKSIKKLLEGLQDDEVVLFEHDW